MDEEYRFMVTRCLSRDFTHDAIRNMMPPPEKIASYIAQEHLTNFLEDNPHLLNIHSKDVVRQILIGIGIDTSDILRFNSFVDFLWHQENDDGIEPGAIIWLEKSLRYSIS